jgi:predicted TIM-barrel fold metal-dependent hydrolase
MQEQNKIRIVDAHHHLWDLKGPVTYSWLIKPRQDMVGDYSKIQTNFLPADYLRESRSYDVVATVHIEAEADHATEQLRETQWLTQVNADNGFPNVLVAHAWVDTPDAEEVIKKQSGNRLVRGIRSKPVTSAAPNECVRGQPRSMQDERWLRGLALIEKHQLSWDLRIPWWHLKEAAEVVKQYPNLTVILNHTGCPWDRSVEGLAGWRQGMEALASNPNVACKISGFFFPRGAWKSETLTPIIRDAISIFGVERCMFASNFPVDGLKGSWDHLYSCFKAAVADLPLAERRKLFSENALRFYGIKLG